MLARLQDKAQDESVQQVIEGIQLGIQTEEMQTEQKKSRR